MSPTTPEVRRYMHTVKKGGLTFKFAYSSSLRQYYSPDFLHSRQMDRKEENYNQK